MSGVPTLHVPAAPSSTGEHRTFDALYEAHFDFIYRCLRRLGVPAAHAEDAAQDTFIVLHRRWSDLRPDASERGFLFAIALRVARAERRGRWNKRADSLDQETQPALEQKDAFEQASETQALQTLERFLDTLDEDKRVAFMLTELEELSAPEIAQALELPVNTVYSRVRPARERFVRFLRAEGRRT
jgi:RNA polymerase sigma-70 factor, ECF subfamily